MLDHDGASSGSQSLCDDLFRALNARIGDLQRVKTNRVCGFYQPKQKRFAYVYHRKTEDKLEVWFSGKVPNSEDYPHLPIRPRTPSTGGFGRDFQARFYLESPSQLHDAVALLYQVSRGSPGIVAIRRNHARPANKNLPKIPEEVFNKEQERNEARATKLSIRVLLQRAKNATRIPAETQVSSKRYKRNPYVAEMARRRAHGVCQLCNLRAPFVDKHGRPFLELHHIIWLSKNGVDTLENTVALCPNCHRRIHVLDRKRDKAILMQKAKQRPAYS